MTVYENDEIDLKPYIQALVRKWWIVLILAALGAGLGIAISQLQAKQYEATTIILLTKQTSKLSLSSQFPTTTEPSDTRSRTDTIITLAESDAIAAQVMQAIQDQWPADNKLTLDKIKKIIDLKVQGEALLLTIKAADPLLAEKIANTWAQILIDAVNLAYSGEQPLEQIQLQLASAETDYMAAQTALETFLQSSQIEALQLKLDGLDILYSGQSSDQVLLYGFFESRKNNMVALQIQAEALKAQLLLGTKSNAGNVGDALAILLARASALNITTNIENSTKKGYSVNASEQSFISQYSPNSQTLTIQITDLEPLHDTDQNHLADLDVVIMQAKAEQEKADAALADLAQTVLNAENDPVIEETLAGLRESKAQLENEQAHLEELRNARDLNWTAYQALLAKETEIKNGPKESRYVVLISEAAVPEKSISRGTLRNLVMGGAAGFFASALLILLGVWWKSAGIMAVPEVEKTSPQSDHKT